jgi:hypothetical protein
MTICVLYKNNDWPGMVPPAKARFSHPLLVILLAGIFADGRGDVYVRKEWRLFCPDRRCALLAAMQAR